MLIKVSLQTTELSYEITSIPFVLVIMNLEHLENNLSTFVFRVDWRKCLGEGIQIAII